MTFSFGGGGGVSSTVFANGGAANQFATSLVNGALVLAQPAFANLSGSIAAGQIAANTIVNAALAQMAANTIKGNNTGGASAPLDLTVAQVNAILPVFTSALNGSVPLSGGGTTNFLRADGAWAAAGGGSGITQLTGDVTAGPGTGSQIAILANIPNLVTQPGSILATAIATPAAPAAGLVKVFASTASGHLGTINSAGTVSTTVVPATSALANNWVTFISATGVQNIARPAYADLTGKAVIAIQIISSGVTYTATAGTKTQIVEGWGGGGGGGGSVIGTAANSGMGGGGGSGGYFRRQYNIVGGGTGTVAIGAAGAAGANTGAVAGSGGNTTFTDGTTLCTANGGVGAPAQVAVAATFSVSLGGAGAAISTNGQMNTKGVNGGNATRMVNAAVATPVISGAGGATPLGGEGQARTTQGAGNAAQANTGSGGAGGVAIGAVAAVTGGAGGTGLIVITEFA